ncbi:hypothetical protein [Streptomyces sp. NPDC053431]|uniref:hypothetical protein n=1 Tax=Streptomyces sp. NPDC053431 TaxID=3365703 RepID=UPI0037D694A3
MSRYAFLAAPSAAADAPKAAVANVLTCPPGVTGMPGVTGPTCLTVLAVLARLGGDRS